MHELRADIAAVAPARFLGVLRIDIEFGDGLLLEVLAERIEARLEMSPLPEGVEYLFTRLLQRQKLFG
jgi:hypothetical protein